MTTLMQHSSQRKQPAPNNMHWSKGNRSDSSSSTVKSLKCAAPLQSHINRVGQHIQQPHGQSVSQPVWLAQTEQPGPVWMWGENSRQEEMRRVRRKGGNKEKVFGCDLLEHLNASSQESEWTDFFLSTLSSSQYRLIPTRVSHCQKQPETPEQPHNVYLTECV